MRKYLTELIGTFFLVLTIGITVTTKNAMAPLAIGAILMVMIFAGGHVSGAHYNPAVTLAVLIRGRITAAEAVPYVIAQLIGGVIAAGAVRWIVNQGHPQALHLSGHAAAVAFLAELLFTFALAYVVLNVATSKSHPVNSFYGLAIGFTVMAGAWAVGGISGGSFNPAVSVGGAVMGLFSWSTFGIQLVADLVGAALAAGVFLLINPDDRGVPPAPSDRAVAEQEFAH